MKLGLVIYGSLDTLSGGFLYDRKMVQGLRRAGHTVQVFSLPWRNYARHLSHNLNPLLVDNLARLDVDILLQDELNHPSLFLLNRYLRQRARFSLVSIVHHLRLSESQRVVLKPLYRAVERAYLKTADAFIFNSQTTCRSVFDLLGQTAPHIVAYPAGDRLHPYLSEAEIRARAAAIPPLRILFVGNLIPRKGLHTLLHALANLPPHTWLLTVVGASDHAPRYARRVRALCARLRLENRVRFTGALDSGALAAQYRAHHVLAVPSQYEGFGIVYLEGMGFGLPALATTSGATSEIITHGQDGFLLPPDDPQALAAALAKLIADPQRLSEMSIAARQRYLRHPTWEQSASRVEAFLRTLPAHPA